MVGVAPYHRARAAGPSPTTQETKKKQTNSGVAVATLPPALQPELRLRGRQPLGDRGAAFR